MTVPASSTAICRSRVTNPVSRSTSTTDMCVPNGNVGFSWLKSSCAPSPCIPSALSSTPSGNCSFAAVARSAQLSDDAGTPITPIVPSSGLITISSVDASRRWAATDRALSTTASVAVLIADPPNCREREPPVPPPRGTMSVSDCTSVILSTGIPVNSDTIIAKLVWCPCPCADVPAFIVAEPSLWISTDAYSDPPPGLVTST